MPVFVVDGRPYRVPSKALFKGNKDICKKIIVDKVSPSLLLSPPDQHDELTGKHERATLKPKVSLEQATATRTPRRKDTAAADETNHAWSTREDRILRELIALRLPWSRMSMALGNRPVDEIRSRWGHIRRGKLDEIEREAMVDGAVSTGIGGRPHYPMQATTQDSKLERHVSFADPLVTGGDIDDDDEEEDFSSDPPNVKKVYYIDKEFSLEDVAMLHNIAAKWERDRWLAISTRFNDITQRSITPEQAKSVIDG